MKVGTFELKSCEKCNNGVWMLPELKECPYCGSSFFVEYGSNVKFKNTRKKKRINYTDEEILGTGLYPKDEGYKMSLISRILEKR